VSGKALAAGECWAEPLASSRWHFPYILLRREPRDTNPTRERVGM